VYLLMKAWSVHFMSRGDDEAAHGAMTALAELLLAEGNEGSGDDATLAAPAAPAAIEAPPAAAVASEGEGGAGEVLPSEEQENHGDDASERPASAAGSGGGSGAGERPRTAAAAVALSDAASRHFQRGHVLLHCALYLRYLQVRRAPQSSPLSRPLSILI